MHFLLLGLGWLWYYRNDCLRVIVDCTGVGRCCDPGWTMRPSRQEPPRSHIIIFSPTECTWLQTTGGHFSVARSTRWSKEN